MLLAALQPANYVVSRELVINAPPEKIFPYINSSMNLSDWMPPAVTDRDTRTEFTGPDQGVDSAAKWESPSSMASGHFIIVSSTGNSTVVFEWTQVKPIAKNQKSTIHLTPASNGTTVNWSKAGPNSRKDRLLEIFKITDRKIGKELETGLQSLKKTVESSTH